MSDLHSTIDLMIFCLRSRENDKLCFDAADEIERLQAENLQLRGAYHNFVNQMETSLFNLTSKLEALHLALTQGK